MVRLTWLCPGRGLACARRGSGFAFAARAAARDLPRIGGSTAAPSTAVRIRSSRRMLSAASVRLVREHGLFAFCRALFNANEFVFVF